MSLRSLPPARHFLTTFPCPQAIVTLRLASFSLGILSTMLEFTPASFADTGEVEAVRVAAKTHGIEKLGKAERYLLELSKVPSSPSHSSHALQIPRVENYLRVMALLLSLEDIKKQTLRAATVIFSVAEEVGSLFSALSPLPLQIRGSNRFKVLLQSILRIGNVLNQGTKKRSVSSPPSPQTAVVALRGSRSLPSPSSPRRSPTLERRCWSIWWSEWVGRCRTCWT